MQTCTHKLIVSLIAKVMLNLNMYLEEKLTLKIDQNDVNIL